MAESRKTIHIFFGFFFIVNFCLGTGFLGIPYAFFYSGYLAAVPSLLLVSAISWINANYLLEVMARAQALEYYNMGQKRSVLDSNDELSMETTNRIHPIFEITTKRKFEILELCEIFFNKWVKYVYLIILSVYCFLALWSFSTVAGSAWAINIPYNFSGVVKCGNNPDPFQHVVIPEEASCRNAYYFSLFVFAIIVVTLSLINLKDLAIFQMILGFFRFLTVAAIVSYSIVKLSQGRDVCAINDFPPKDVSFYPEVDLYNDSYTSSVDVVTRFNPKGWVTAIPVMTYAFILHQGIASLTHPIRQKRYLWHLTSAMFSIALFCYMLLGVVVPLWFKQSIQETITLNFSKLTSHEYSFPLRFFAYYIIIFPSVDVVSAYPLLVHTIVNNLYIIIVGHDTSKTSTYKYKWLDFLLRITLQFFAALLPILAAFAVANLFYVLKYAGLMGFNICFLFPTILQFRSIYVCRRCFSTHSISISGTRSPEEEKQSLLRVQEGTLFQDKKTDERAQYMTPFSSRIFSHPVAVVIVGLLGFCLFVLAIVSLGVYSDKVIC